MQHVITSGKSVHIVPFESARTPICGNGLIWKEVEGEKYRNMYPTIKPVTCKNCRLGLMMVARDQLENLSALGIEHILDVIASMRNGELVK